MDQKSDNSTTLLQKKKVAKENFSLFGVTKLTLNVAKLEQLSMLVEAYAF